MTAASRWKRLEAVVNICTDSAELAFVALAILLIGTVLLKGTKMGGLPL